MQRFLIPAWVGAAVLFVFTSVAEQKSDHFGSSIKNYLAMIRFPYYYAFGFILLLTAVVCSVGILLGGRRSKSAFAVFVLLLAVTAMMIYDFKFVYQPLAEIMKDVLRPRDDEFTKYHDMSKHINGCEIILCAIAAVLVCREPRAEAIESDGTTGT